MPGRSNASRVDASGECRGILSASMMADSHRAPAVLQILPRLERDELGRNTLDIARHLRAQGWRSIVASAGGALERELAAAGATHLQLPLDATGWLAQRANAGRLAARSGSSASTWCMPAARVRPRSGALAARRAGASFITTFHEPLPADGSPEPSPPAGDGLGRAGDRGLPVRGRARRHRPTGSSQPGCASSTAGSIRTSSTPNGCAGIGCWRWPNAGTSGPATGW